jgi:hypothetical protein
LQRVNSAEHSLTPINVRLGDFRTPSLDSSISEISTALRWETPPAPAPSPPRVARGSANSNADNHAVDANEAIYKSPSTFVVRFDEEQIRSSEAEAATRKRMEVDLESSPPTPNVDDMPYIRFAIEQLTRDEDVGAAAKRSQTSSSSNDNLIERLVHDQGLGYYQHGTSLTREELALARKHRSSPAFEPKPLFRFNPTRPLSYPSNLPQYHPNRYSGTEVFIPVQPPVHNLRYPGLTYVPMILRPISMITLALLCLLMIAAIIFCAVYSTKHSGLVGWSGGIHDGLYFVFGFLPQILASIIFVYVQAVVATITRIMPFTLMAMNDAESRTNALFLGVYPKSFFWTGGDGPMSIYVSNLFFWLTIFTIPLQCCLFSVIPVAGEWRWTAVQGVAWTLVTIYVCILIATGLSGLFFFRRTTGLLWDPRTLADIIALLPRTNSLQDYPGTEIMRSRGELRDRLIMRSDRLGYWRTQNETQGIFYCLGEEGTPTRRYTLEAGKLHQKPTSLVFDDLSDIEKSAGLYSRATRFRHIPWQLRDAWVIIWSVTAFTLLVALLVISFLPSTAIRNGFPPLVSAMPNTQGYSPANFLYSFVPSVLGMLLYLLFQPLDMGLRRLQPWAELGNSEGATSGRSLLLDYPADLPIECTWKALKEGHYRVAAISALSFLFILLPVLAGGVFFPLTTKSEGVRIIPNLPSFYIVLTILLLYLIALLILVPSRYQMHLPHSVDCLAEIFSFVYNSGILTDAAFRAPRSKQDLVTRLTALSAAGHEARYAFGVYRGRNGKESLGIERIGRRGAQEVMILSGR